MYFRESEVIAEQHPALADLISEIDDRLSRIRSMCNLRPDDFSIVLGVELNQVAAILELFVQHDILTACDMIECRGCDALMLKEELDNCLASEEVFECNGCGRRLHSTQGSRVVFRLSTVAQNRIAAECARLNQIEVASRAANEPLSPREKQVLAAMWALGAIDSDHRKTTVQICERAFDGAFDENSVKAVMAQLRKDGYVKAARGPGGGFWLTPLGQERARKLCTPMSNNYSTPIKNLLDTD